MRAARSFMEEVAAYGSVVTALRAELFGSLALTGYGHATDRAILLGLAGERPETVDPSAIPRIVDEIRSGGSILTVCGTVPFSEEHDLLFRRGVFLDGHSNAMRFTALLADGTELSREYHSIGGGAIVAAGASAAAAGHNLGQIYPFSSAAELLALGDENGLSIGEIVLRNEVAWRPREETFTLLDRVVGAMMASIDRGVHEEGLLPGGLKVPRRARTIHARLRSQPREQQHARVFEWVSLFALAVNEENAAGGRVVTAPTNGAAGVIPAVIRYYLDFVPGADARGTRTFLLTASAIGFLYKKRASISAAEMGCQGEVGVACSMAAAGLAAVLGGTNAQIENAAEIGMEHNLGLTCDPIGGLVQIPCIERNTMGAVKAINAAYLALQGDGRHVVSLDAVIETMRQTGEDMQSRYKETSLGGLAVNVVEC